ncbi:6472_t:CDS:2 [Funneliformis geosporum]|uniref:4944_t:CDS:1 n=1 Tax=Funneliformis geosporum TaxID=1117311 RepID=A0A9W4X1M9_9GLOM|nr:6472_t:CDS:2 [Funneliformis geosporum]CAI2179818.1 4944_t:CDS:2 [Funneliformis geosporum]
MPKIRVVDGSKKFPHPEEKLASTKEEARKRVGYAVESAREAKEGENKVFSFKTGGYSNTNRESFESAVQALSGLIKIAKNDGSGDGFNDVKTSIHKVSQINEEEEKAKTEEREKIQKELEQKRAEEEEKARAKLTKDFQEIPDNVDFDNQKTEEIFTNIEELKSSRESNVYEEQEEEIKEKKDKLAEKNFQGYGKFMAKLIQKKIDGAKVKIDKIGGQIKAKLDKLMNGETSSVVETRQIEEEVSEKVSEEVAKVEVDNLLTQAQNLLSGAVSDLENQLGKLKRDFYSLKSSLNPYQRKACQERYREVSQSLKALESISLNKVQPSISEPSLFRPELVIPVALVVALMVALLIKVRRRKI